MELHDVIRIVETLRPQLQQNDGGAFHVCRDAALEAGWKFRAVRSRRVVIKKSNRRDMSMARLNNWFRNAYRLEDVIPRPEALFRPTEADRAFHMPVIDETGGMPPGFQFIGSPQTASGRMQLANDLVEADLADARSLIAAINAPPTLPRGAVEIVPSPMVPEGQAVLMDNRLIYGGQAPAPTRLQFSREQEPGNLFGIDASSYDLWSRPRLWESEICIVEADQLAKRALAREEQLPNRPGARMVLDRIDLSSRSVTYRAATRPIGQPYERPVVLGRPPRVHRKERARTPTKFQNTRLDGRRR